MKGKHLRSLLKVIPKNNIRYFLNGLYVNFDYREIAATDGHIFRVVFPKKETTYEDSRFCWFQSEFVKIVEKIAKDYVIDFEFFPPENEKTSPLKLTGVSSDCSAFVTILLCKMDVDINGKNKFKRSYLDGKTYFKD